MEASPAGKEKETNKVEEVTDEAILKINAKDRPFDAALFGETVQKGFSKMYNDPLLSDITLLLGEERLPAHRMVLCAWSETFRSMLSQEWRESQLNELPIQVEPEDHEHFKNMLKYMYTGDVTFVRGGNVINLIRLSDYYGILSLKEVCGELLGEQLDSDNVFYLLDIVEHFDVQSLNVACGRYLAEHFSDMLEETPERLHSLKPSTWVEIMKSDDLQMRSEEKLLEAVLKYAEQFSNEADKETETINTLLPYIRWPFIRPNYLIKKVEPNEKINKLPLLHKLLHETYRYRMYSKSKTTFSTVARRGFQRFDPEHSTSVIKLSEDNLKATLSTSSGWQNVRCVCPFSEAYNYCEFKIESGPNIMVGVVQGDCARSGYAGQYANGWTYYTHGGMYHSGSTPSTGENYTAGDRIGVKVSLEEGKVYFYKNGKLTTTGTGLPKSGELFYPIACFSAVGDSVSIVEKAVKKDTAEDKEEEKKLATTPAPSYTPDPYDDVDY